MSSRQATVLVAELRSIVRTRDEQLSAFEHDLNNEVGTLQLVVHLLRCDSDNADRDTLMEALTETTGRIRQLLDGFRKGNYPPRAT